MDRRHPTSRPLERPYSAPPAQGLDEPGRRIQQPRAAICRAIARSPTKRAVSQVAQNVAQIVIVPP